MRKLKYTLVSAAALSLLLASSNLEALAITNESEKSSVLEQTQTNEEIDASSSDDVAEELLKVQEEPQLDLNEETTPPEDSTTELTPPTEEKESPVNEEAEVVFSYATIKKGASLYIANKTTSSVGALKNSTTRFAVKKVDNKDFYAIKVGATTYWVKKNDLTAAKSATEAIKKTLVTAFKTKTTYKIYSKATTSSTIIMTASKAQNWSSVDVVKGYYVVDINGQKGYIPFNQVNAPLKANKKAQVITTAKLYEVINGKNKAIGTLSKGAVIKIASVSSSTIKFKRGKRQFILSKKALIPTTKAESFGTLKKASYPVTLTAEKKATIYTSKKNAVGTLNKGNSVKLVALSGDYGIINFAGRNGYVKLSQFKHSNIVDPTKNISSAKYSYYVKVINKLYPEFTKLEKIGKSVEGRPLYALQVGTGKKEILVDGGIHAREHMTTNVLMEMIDQYTVSYRSKTKFSGYNTRKVLDKTSIWFIPMINPDGVTLVQSGLKAMKPENQKIIKAYNKSSYYARWKANGRGVDLNRNFDAVWSLLGNTPKSFMGYKGPSAFSEPESKAVKAFVESHKFKADYSYHSSGQVLYWYNFQNKKNYARDLNLTRKVSKITGYSVIAPVNNRASGSSADWFILSQKQPGLTIEIAPYSGLGPVPHKYWSSIWAKNKTIGLFGANEASSR